MLIVYRVFIGVPSVLFMDERVLLRAPVFTHKVKISIAGFRTPGCFK